MQPNFFPRNSVGSQTPIRRRSDLILQCLLLSIRTLPPVLLLLALPVALQAQFNYTTNNGTITITRYTGTGGDVTIPSTINGLPVTSIGDLLFYLNFNLTSITIPNSVTTIGAGAFENCGTLTNLSIPGSVNTIGDAAFAGCYVSAITVDALNPAFSSLDGVLFNKSQTTLIQFPADNSGTFYTIPNSVTSIGNYAFSYCNFLVCVKIPDSVTSIKQYAFWNCGNLTSATIPNSVTTIEDWAFAWTRLSSVTIPDSVASIGASAFSYCLSLTSVTIGNNVTNIGDSAFAQCSSLSSVCFLGNAPSLGEDVFDYREYGRFFPPPGYRLHYDPATVYYLPGTIGWGPTFGGLSTALWNMQSQMSYTIVNGTVTITGYTGPGGAVTIPDTISGLPVTSIGGAFSERTNLTSVTIPNSVTNIGEYAFSGCSGLTSVTIPNSVTNIGENAFDYCTSLTSVMIGNSVTSIGDNAFFFCTSLTNATLPDNLSSIGGWAFSICGLINVRIPDSVTRLGDGVLSGCSRLTSVTIGNGVTNIGVRAFEMCSSLSSITMDTSNPTFSSVDGVLFNKSQTTLIEYPGGKTGSYTVPNGVGSIGEAAFSGCSSLSGITIPNGVATIGDFVFSDCIGLTSLTIPKSVISLGVQTFARCANLTSMYFQGNAPTADPSVFYIGDIATVYYLPGTTGWGTTYGGLPTKLWNPQVQAADASFGVRSNQFGFNITGTANIQVMVEASTNLASPVWSPLQTMTLTNGLVHFSDPQWRNYPGRFYRIRSP